MKKMCKNWEKKPNMRLRRRQCAKGRIKKNEKRSETWRRRRRRWWRERSGNENTEKITTLCGVVSFSLILLDEQRDGVTVVGMSGKSIFSLFVIFDIWKFSTMQLYQNGSKQKRDGVRRAEKSSATNNGFSMTMSQRECLLTSHFALFFVAHLTPVCVTSTIANNYGLTLIRCMCRPKHHSTEFSSI